MKSNKFIQGRLDRTDVKNAEDLQLQVTKHLENGTPLDEWIENKVAKRCAKYGFRRIRVLAELVRSFVLCTEFAKSATRQRVAEKAQIENFNRNGLKVVKLADVGSDSIRLMGGDLVYGRIGRLARATKSIDAQYGNEFLFMKWTNESGGSQENQWRDALGFIDAANEYIEKHNNNVKFVVILDGPFYGTNWARYKQYATPRLLVETSDSYIARNQKATTTTVSDDIVVRHTTA